MKAPAFGKPHEILREALAIAFDGAVEPRLDLVQGGQVGIEQDLYDSAQTIEQGSSLEHAHPDDVGSLDVKAVLQPFIEQPEF